jgi:threonylcarbamoyladenosine tRNA methylthiotransferase MtaB
MPKFSVWTFGCRCNQADSAAIREGLCRRSMSESEKCREAEIIVINTCTVTHRADQQARQLIRRLHRENPSARLVVTGCYAERDPGTLASLPGVDCVIGNADKDCLPELIENSEHSSQGRIIHTPIDAECDYCLPPMTHTGGKTRPLVKLQDGCDARCSYCIVPKVRGRGRSAKPEDIIAEVQSLVSHGFQEIVLTGIHLGAYGRRLKGQASLIDLLRRIVEIPGLGRIRLSSIEPMLFDRAIVKLAAESPVIAHHFHIPLQSGSARILQRMHRPYTPARFQDLLRFIHSELPDAGLGTDLLVGFPGETENDFSETCALIEDLPLTYLHVFPFSPREGTEAYSLPDPVPSLVVKRRLAKALEISRSKNLAFRRKFLGKALPAITLSKEENLGASIALTGNYIHARVPERSAAPNRLVEIRIDDVLPDATYASIISVTGTITSKL